MKAETAFLMVVAMSVWFFLHLLSKFGDVALYLGAFGILVVTTRLGKGEGI